MKRSLVLILSLVLVVSLIPTAVFAVEDVTEVRFNVVVPKELFTVTGLDDIGANKQTPQIEVTIPEGSPYYLNGDDNSNYATWFYEDQSIEYPYPSNTQRFQGTMTGNGKYWARIALNGVEGKKFSDDVKVIVNGGALETHVYYNGYSEYTGASNLAVDVKIPVEHEGLGDWEIDNGSFVGPTVSEDGYHLEHRYCSVCEEIADTRKVTDDHPLTTLTIIAPTLKAGDGYEVKDGDITPYPVIKLADEKLAAVVETTWLEESKDISGGFVLPTESRTFKPGDVVYMAAFIIPDPDGDYAFPVDGEGEENSVKVKVQGGEFIESYLRSYGPSDGEHPTAVFDTSLSVIFKVTIPKDEAPKTGDTNALYCMAAVLSVAVLITLLYANKKRQSR